MTDSGGPEDPEIAKLREQLAAAERLAELRAELEAAQDELAAIDADIRQQEKDARDPKVASGPAPETKTNRAIRVWLIRILAVGILGGVVALVAFMKGPTIELTCPPPSKADADALSVTIGRKLSWRFSKIDFIDVDYGDETYKKFIYFSGGYPYNSQRADDLFTHTYESPGVYEITGSVMDGRDEYDTDSCWFVWDPS